jgi:FkbM family methyltransferase
VNQPPLRFSLAAAVTRILPAGRYRAAGHLCRLLRIPPPFTARAPRRLGTFQWECDLRDIISRDVFFAGQYEPQETLLIRRLVRAGATFVDVGANWGYYSLIAAVRVGRVGRVLALEPDARVFAALQRNLDRNDLRQATALAVAAHREDGEAALAGFDPALGNFGTSRVVAAGQSETRSVPARRLDGLLAQHDLRRVDLLKMDIEGGEGFALAGLNGALEAGWIDRVLVELHPDLLASHGYSVQQACRPLLDAGFTGWMVDHSVAATRRAAYGRDPSVSSLLAPLDLARLDAWPHLLWVRPGIALWPA